VPSTYALLLQHTALGEYDFSSLRYLTQAGGAMSPQLTQRLRAALPHPRLFVMYGQTEATSRISWLPPEKLDEKLGSVGIPVQGLQWKILREDSSPAGVGESGEVWVQGPNVMQGYWDNAAATASVLAEGWLRTGDVGYLDDDGFLFLQGRRSDMIKTGAHRVHPTDVEEVIAEMPGVTEVAVVGVEDEVLGQVIKAFVVASDLPPRAEERIKAHCRARLAPYKIPKHVAFVDALPRTASGKVRRVQLMELQSTP
jgi:acyl-CoA synthetase (AMP-forming)/AMP-acid ligase II